MIIKKIICLFLMISVSLSIFIKLKDENQKICFIIRSEFSKEFVNFSYVVHSSIY